MNISPRGIAVGVITAVAVLSLGACSSAIPDTSPSPTQSQSPSPTADATRPMLEQLRLTPAGMDYLVVGAPVPETPTDVAIVEFDPRGCLSEESPNVEGDPGAGFWIPSYSEDQPFQVVTEGRVRGARITSIQVGSPYVVTDTGIMIGSTLDELLAAYPGIAVVPDSGVTLVYVVDGAEGMLAFEVANDIGAPGYWQPEQVNTIVYMTAYALDQSVSAIYATDSAGACTV